MPSVGFHLPDLLIEYENMSCDMNQLQRCALMALGLFLALFTAQAMAQEDLEALEEQSMKAAVAKVAPSVVRIETFGGLESVGRLLVGTGPTTGLAMTEDGYVISSAFNFVQQPSSILVTMPSGERATAEIVGRDQNRMVVLLKVNSEEKLAVPEIVPRNEMAVGQWTLAVGRTFEGGQVNMSVGVLSARSRIWGKAIQTDAKISPSNYGGALVDIRGRVLGVLVPLSPQRHGEIAGAEWYDSGIGFAIPLADIMPQLEKLKRGETLMPGLLGVALKGGDIYSDPAEIAACQPKSPAYRAGLKAGDRIVELDGTPISRQVQLKHALGGHYAGDKVKLVVMRDDKRVEAVVELTDKLEPYEHPFVGVLPWRSPTSDPGIVVRFIYPGAPAAEAGMKVKDRIVELAGKPVADLDTALEILANHEPGEEVPVEIERAGQAQELTIKLGSLPDSIPDALPPAREPLQGSDAEQPPVGEVDVKLPEEKNECLAYVPERYEPNVVYGVVVWLHEPGGFDREKLLARWKDHCDKNDLILLAPQAADPSRWVPTEVDFIHKTLDDIISKYNVDPTRIVAHGYQAGAAMAYMTAFAHRDVVRAVAAVDAGLPARARVAANDPVERLAIHATYAKSSKLAERIKGAVTRLKAMKYPVIAKELDGDARYLNDEELSELVRWIDTLDRL